MMELLNAEKIYPASFSSLTSPRAIHLPSCNKVGEVAEVIKKKSISEKIKKASIFCQQENSPSGSPYLHSLKWQQTHRERQFEKLVHNLSTSIFTFFLHFHNLSPSSNREEKSNQQKSQEEKNRMKKGSILIAYKSRLPNVFFSFPALFMRRKLSLLHPEPT